MRRKIIVAIVVLWFLFYGFTYGQEQIKEIQKGVTEPEPEMIHEMGHPFEVFLEIKGIIECPAFLKKGIGLGKILVTEFRDGSESLTSTIRKIPSGFKIESIEILIDLRHARPIFDWFKKWAKGKGNKKNVTIILINPHSKEKYQINVVQSWPSQLKVILHPQHQHQPRLLIYFEAEDVLI